MDLMSFFFFFFFFFFWGWCPILPKLTGQIIAGGCVGFEPTAITSRYYVIGGSRSFPARTHGIST
ncbi:hypothetical protein B0H10DRAFT_2135153 [Mycena sp. CBHHK59/15]|nr:hypothetical protein B0H10DRAFT_2135153 [Mycena sp. CBHHK59/15]